MRTDFFRNLFFQNKINFYALVVFLFFLRYQITADEASIIKVSAHPEYPPFMYEYNKQIEGIIPIVVTEILNSLGVSYNCFPVGPWSRVLVEAKAGNIDIIAGLFKSAEREEYLYYVPTPVFENPSVVFVKKGCSFKFESWSDLKGKKIGAIWGDRFNPEFDKFLDNNKNSIVVERVTSQEQNFKKLRTNRIDCIIYSQIVGTLIARKINVENSIEILPKAAYTGKLYIAISKKSKFLNLIPLFNERIIAFKQDGTITNLVDIVIDKYVDEYRHE